MTFGPYYIKLAYVIESNTSGRICTNNGRLNEGGKSWNAHLFAAAKENREKRKKAKEKKQNMHSSKGFATDVTGGVMIITALVTSVTRKGKS